MQQTTVHLDVEQAPNTRAGEALDQLLYSAHAFSAMVVPVATTMILTSLAVVYVNDGSNGQTSGGQGIPLVFQETGDETNTQRFTEALVNALTIVGVIILATFFMVFLYYFNFIKLLVGWLVCSVALLLGFSTGLVVQIAFDVWNVPFDIVSYSFIFYNFAIVGVISVFVQRGVPQILTALYLIVISVTMAWILTRYLPEWTTWLLLALLALYDMCAVLTPCGPLNCLVGM